MTSPFKPIPSIIGAPRVFEWRPIVTFACACDRGPPLLISGADGAAVCQACGQTYVLGRLHFDRNRGFGAGVELRKIARPVES
jgi:hypothetical protein